MSVPVEPAELIKDSLKAVFHRDNLVALWIGALLVALGGSLSLGLLLGPLMLGYAHIGLKVARNETPTLGDLKVGMERWVPAFVTSVLSTIALLLGFTLFVLPGLVFLFLISFVWTAMADDPELSSIRAFRFSAQRVRDNLKNIAVLWVLTLLLGSLLGATVIGGLFTMIFFNVFVSLLYERT